MSDGRKIRITFEDFDEETCRPVIDAIFLVLVEHGFNVEGMKEWTDELYPA